MKELHMIKKALIKQTLSLLSLVTTNHLLAEKAEPSRDLIPQVTICTTEDINKDTEVEGVLFWQDAPAEEKVLCQDAKDWLRISIKYRGHSSMKFAKKQYSVTFLDAEGKKMKRALGKLTTSEDWIFRTPFIDRSYMRDALAYQLGQKMGLSRGESYAAPRTQMVEIFVNDDYRGIFTLSEKIEPDTFKVPIKKIKKEQTSFEYIMEISARDFEYKTAEGTMLNFKYPSLKKLAKMGEDDASFPERVRKQIQQEIDAFEKALASDDFKDPEKGYRSFLDVPSAIDFFIMQELTKNIDGFRRSAFFYRAQDGKFHLGPLWDFDIAWGNLSFYFMDGPKGWSHTKPWIVFPAAFWFRRLLQDPYFVEQLQQRYSSLRQAGQILDYCKIEQDIQEIEQSLGESPLRDQLRWEGKRNWVQEHVLNTAKHAPDFAGNVQILKDWIQSRLHWLDEAMRKGNF